jgi:hypothetical protein
MTLLKEHSPARNQLPWKTHEKTQKTLKTLKTLDLGVSLQGTTFPKKQKINYADSDRSESLQERRRVRFGNRTLPLILKLTAGVVVFS